MPRCYGGVRRRSTKTGLNRGRVHRRANGGSPLPSIGEFMSESARDVYRFDHFIL